MEARLEPVVQGECDQGSRSLPVRGQLADLDAAIVVAKRLDPLRAVIGEILLVQPRGGGDRRGDLSPVEGIRPVCREARERLCEVGDHESSSHPRGGERGSWRPGPLVGDPCRAGHSVRSELGRVGERSVEAEPPEALREVTPGAHGARDGDRARARVVDAELVEHAGGAARPVEPVEAPVVPDERERVASHSVVRRLRDREHRRRRERRVHRVAALAERREARCRGERVARRNHRLARDGRHPPPPARVRRAGAEERLQVELHAPILAGLLASETVP